MWERIARYAVAGVGLAGVAVGVAHGNMAAVAAGMGLAAWALPWLREVQQSGAIREATALIEALRHAAQQKGPPVPDDQLQRTVERLRRVSTPPPSKGPQR